MLARGRAGAPTALREPEREHLEHHHGDQHRRPDDREHEHEEARRGVAGDPLLAGLLGAPRRPAPPAAPGAGGPPRLPLRSPAPPRAAGARGAGGPRRSPRRRPPRTARAIDASSWRRGGYHRYPSPKAVTARRRAYGAATADSASSYTRTKRRYLSAICCAASPRSIDPSRNPFSASHQIERPIAKPM